MNCEINWHRIQVIQDYAIHYHSELITLKLNFYSFSNFSTLLFFRFSQPISASIFWKNSFHSLFSKFSLNDCYQNLFSSFKKPFLTIFYLFFEDVLWVNFRFQGLGNQWFDWRVFEFDKPVFYWCKWEVFMERLHFFLFRDESNFSF